jgi:hypothetical protein
MLHIYGDAEFDKRHIRRAGKDLVAAMSRPAGGTARSAELPKSIRDLMVRPATRLLKRYIQGVALEIERCFGEPLKDLIKKLPADSAGGPTVVSVDHNEEWRVSLLVSKGRVNYNVELSPFSDELWIVLTEHFHREFSERNSSAVRAARGGNTDATLYLLEGIFDQLVSMLFRSFPFDVHYLPSARSGMLHSHRALAAALVRQSSYAGIEDFAIPKLPGVVTDFIGQLLELNPNKKTPFGATARYLEKQILHGDIELIPQVSSYPEIRFAPAGASHALHRTSSMVSELAPVVLFLRHVVGKYDLLIVEEPESHLHPTSQVKFARALGLLLAEQATVLVTTHSDYFLNQLNNLIRLDTLQKRSNNEDSDERSIDPEHVRAYLFAPTNVGSEVRALSVSNDDGVSDAEFADVADWLYNESAALTRELNDSDA